MSTPEKPVLFRSVRHPGVVMNRYGIVLSQEKVCPELRGELVREALAAGWRLDYGVEANDVGRTWQPPLPT